MTTKERFNDLRHFGQELVKTSVFLMRALRVAGREGSVSDIEDIADDIDGHMEDLRFKLDHCTDVEGDWMTEKVQ